MKILLGLVACWGFMSVVWAENATLGIGSSYSSMVKTFGEPIGKHLLDRGNLKQTDLNDHSFVPPRSHVPPMSLICVVFDEKNKAIFIQYTFGTHERVSAESAWPEYKLFHPEFNLDSIYNILSQSAEKNKWILVKEDDKQMIFSSGSLIGIVEHLEKKMLIALTVSEKSALNTDYYKLGSTKSEPDR